MAKRKTTEELISDFKKTHGERYDYSKVEYVGSATKVIIICKIHGEFEQKPYNHRNGQNCSKCSLVTKNKDKKLTTEEFIEKAIKIHGDRYDYSEVDYNKSSEKVVIICNQHSNFNLTPNAHLSGKGCQKCGFIKFGKNKRLKQKDFIEKANEKHNGLYSYEKTIYTKSINNVIITCKEHGDFEQKPNNHLSGKGCLKCFVDKGNFTKSSFVAKSNGRICIFYLIKCYNEEEEFYKIGITSLDIEERFSNKLPYSYDIIYQYEDTSENIYDLENMTRKEYKKHTYKPKIKFGGYTECFTMELPIEKIIKNG